MNWGGLKTPECMCLTKQAHVFLKGLGSPPLLCKGLDSVSVHILCARVKRLVYHVDKALSLDATAPRTSQCAAEDMWSKRNPLHYFTSSFSTQIQT